MTSMMVKTEPDREEARRIADRFERIAREAGAGLEPRKLAALMGCALRRLVEVESGSTEPDPMKAWRLDRNFDPVERDDELQQYIEEAEAILAEFPKVAGDAVGLATLAEAARLALAAMGYTARVQRRDS